MSGNLIVRPDKNEFILYTMLTVLGLERGNPDLHIVKRQALNHFKGYSGIGLKQEDYRHHSKPVSYVLTLNEAPDFSEKQNLTLDPSMQRDADIGRSILPHLKHFYQNTDMEQFYQKILPMYIKECEFLQGGLDKFNIINVLEKTWEVDKPLNMEVIPMPLERMHSGIGPSIGDTHYQIIGPPFDYFTIGLIAHEGSHPIAKKILEPITNEIKTKDYLLQQVLRQSNYPESYHHWPTCFEEHFIRAMQAGYINSNLGINPDVESQLQREEKSNGMMFIREFYSELKNHKKNPTGTLTDVALKILDRIDTKYDYSPLPCGIWQ